MISPRGWQEDALSKFHASRSLCFLVEATPGSGKTIFSGLCAKSLIDRGVCDFWVIVVPTTALKGDKDAGFLGDWSKVGVQITTVLKEGRDHGAEWKGSVVTYQQLPNLVSTFQAWQRKGVRIGFVFDEIHHASEDNTWGAAVEACRALAARILAMTGTPFRGDGKRISFVSYDGDDRAVADVRYSYREAVRDNVCRQVQFMTDDGLAQFAVNEIEREVRISAAADVDVPLASAVIFKRDSEWLRKVIEKADARLDEYRTFDADAGGLVICRPGADDNDDRHLHQVAQLVRDISGDIPEVITHDDQDANAKIERFRAGTSKWICSVRKISEGVDIKRLRVQVMANRPSTELLFRQLVGRVVRVDDPRRRQDATVFLAKFPQLVEWAERISSEAEAGLKDAGGSSGGGERDRNGESAFVPLGSTHEDGGAVSDFGESYIAAEIDVADRLKRGDPQLADVPVTKIAHLLRKIGAPIPESAKFDEPLALQKKRLRGEINSLARRIAIQNNPDKPDFAGVWVSIHRHVGARSLDDLMDNHSIDVMRQVATMLKKFAGGADAAAA